MRPKPPRAEPAVAEIERPVRIEPAVVAVTKSERVEKERQQTLFQDAFRMLGVRKTATFYEAARELGVMA